MQTKFQHKINEEDHQNDRAVAVPKHHLAKEQS